MTVHLLTQLAIEHLPFTLPSVLYAVAWLCSRIQSGRSKRVALKYSAHSYVGRAPHAIGQDMHVQLRPKHRTAIPLNYIDAPFGSYWSGYVNIVVTQNVTNFYALMLTLHEVGHHISHAYIIPPKYRFRLHHPLNRDEKKILQLGLALLPILISVALFNRHNGSDVVGKVHLALLVIAWVWLFLTSTFFIQQLTEEQRAWKQAEIFNHSAQVVPHPAYQEVRRVLLGSYLNLPHSVWVSVERTVRNIVRFSKVVRRTPEQERT